MTEYLIAFNDEWVPDHTGGGIREKSRALRPLVAEMKAAGVLIFTGGLDDAAPVFSVDASSGTPLFTDGPFIESKEHLGGFAVVDVADEEAARLWAGKIAVARGWPQEVRRFRSFATSGDFLTESAGVPAARRRPKPRPHDRLHIKQNRMPGVVVGAGLHLVAAQVPGRSMTRSSCIPRVDHGYEPCWRIAARMARYVMRRARCLRVSSRCFPLRGKIGLPADRWRDRGRTARIGPACGPRACPGLFGGGVKDARAVRSPRVGSIRHMSCRAGGVRTSAAGRSGGSAACLWGSRTRPPVLTWASMRPARTR